MTEQIQTEKPAVVTGTVSFGIGQLDKPSPKWATWTFRIFLYASSLATIIMTTDNAIPAATALLVVKYLGFANIAVHGLSKMVGIDISQDAANAKTAFNLKK